MYSQLRPGLGQNIFHRGAAGAETEQGFHYRADLSVLDHADRAQRFSRNRGEFRALRFVEKPERTESFPIIVVIEAPRIAAVLHDVQPARIVQIFFSVRRQRGNQTVRPVDDRPQSAVIKDKFVLDLEIFLFRAFLSLRKHAYPIHGKRLHFQCKHNSFSPIEGYVAALFFKLTGNFFSVDVYFYVVKFFLAPILIRQHKFAFDIPLGRERVRMIYQNGIFARRGFRLRARKGKKRTHLNLFRFRYAVRQLHDRVVFGALDTASRQNVVKLTKQKIVLRPL